MNFKRFVKDKTNNNKKIVGVERSETAAKVADIIIMAMNAIEGWTEEDTELLLKIQSNKPMILVMNKIDCASSDRCDQLEKKEEIFHKSVYTSAVTGQGIEELEDVIMEILGLDRVPIGGHQWTVNQVTHKVTGRQNNQYRKIQDEPKNSNRIIKLLK